MFSLDVFLYAQSPFKIEKFLYSEKEDEGKMY